MDFFEAVHFYSLPHLDTVPLLFSEVVGDPRIQSEIT